MDLFNLIMGVLGGIISLLMLVIGYFLRQQIQVIHALTESVHSLNKTVAVMENKAENTVLNCGMRHGILDNRLNAHSKDIRELKEDVAVLKSKVE